MVMRPIEIPSLSSVTPGSGSLPLDRAFGKDIVKSASWEYFLDRMEESYRRAASVKVTFVRREDGMGGRR